MSSHIFVGDFWTIWKVVPQTLGLSFLILILATLLGSLFWQIQESRHTAIKFLYHAFSGSSSTVVGEQNIGVLITW